MFEIDDQGQGTVRGVGRKRQGLSHMQSGTVADIAAVVDNCAVALQEAEEMAGFRPTQVVIGIAGELVKGFTTTSSQERKKPDQPITEAELQKLIDAVQQEALREAERAITWETGLPHVDVRLVHAAVTRPASTATPSRTRSASAAATSRSASSTRSPRSSTSARSRASPASSTSS